MKKIVCTLLCVIMIAATAICPETVYAAGPFSSPKSKFNVSSWSFSDMYDTSYSIDDLSVPSIIVMGDLTVLSGETADTVCNLAFLHDIYRDNSFNAMFFDLGNVEAEVLAECSEIFALDGLIMVPQTDDTLDFAKDAYKACTGDKTISKQPLVMVCDKNGNVKRYSAGVELTIEQLKSAISDTVPSSSMYTEAELWANAVLYHTNLARELYGLYPYKTSDRLNDACQIRAQELSTLFAHERPNGSMCFSVLKETGISDYGFSGENAAIYKTSPFEAVGAWMMSAGHRVNLLDDLYTHMGAGYYRTSSGYKNHWVQLFIEGRKNTVLGNESECRVVRANGISVDLPKDDDLLVMEPNSRVEIEIEFDPIYATSVLWFYTSNENIAGLVVIDDFEEGIYSFGIEAYSPGIATLMVETSGLQLPFDVAVQKPQKSYTIKYNGNGGTGAPSSQTKADKKDIKLSTVKPTQPGYIFTEWNTQPNGSGKSFSAGEVFKYNIDLTLYAQWKKDVTYKVTYDANGGTNAPSSQTKRHGEHLTLTGSTPKMDGYIFAGWNTEKDGSGKNYSPKSQFTTNCDTTLYAQWKEAGFTRLSGAGRCETAVAISKASFKKTENVILASGDNYADALAGVPLAYSLDAPILLIRNHTLDDATLGEIKRLGADNVYILGGEAAINAKVAKTLTNKGYSVTRLAGRNRFDTSLEIAKKLQSVSGNPSEIIFVYSHNYPDALAISGVAAANKCPVIYIAGTGKLTDSIASFVKSSGVNKATVIGGTGVINSAAEGNIKKAGASTVNRIYGANRYETCIKINEAYASTLTGKAVCIATGTNYPDALAGGVFAAINRSPLVLVDKSLTDMQTKYVKGKSAENIYVFGGTGVISDPLASEIAEYRA